MKTNFNYIFLFSLFILFVSCSEDKITLTGTGTITGKVVNKGDNEPLENVKVSTNPASSTVFSDVEGNFEIQEVPVNEYSVQAEVSSQR